jgi:hypothetical protein
LVDPFEVVAELEQVPALGTAEDAGEARQVGLDAVGDLATVEHSDAGTGGIAGVTGSPSSWIVNALSRPAKDSATTRVEPSGVTTMAQP